MKLRGLAVITGLFVVSPAFAQQPTSAADGTSPEGRRAIRGGPVEPEPNESPELSEMRHFEDRAFPRGTLPVPPPPDAEGPAPNRTGRSAGELPEPLRPPEGNRSAQEPPPSGSAQSQTQPDAAFLRSLKMPDVPVRWDPRVLRYLQFYRTDPKGRAIMATWLRKQGRFRALFEDSLRRHDLPHDLIYISMIESGYDPTDLSRVGASGLWQFMDAGGKIYGLEQSYWLDQRRNPERATEAVGLYFHDLFVRFGNWHLALAAFNAGYGAVLHAMQKYNTNDYWELCKQESGLPWETCLYVPKAIATAIVGQNRAAFGFGDVQDDAAWAYDRVRVPGGTTLSSAAKACGVPDGELSVLNPELRHGRTPPGREYELRIPAGSLSRFVASFPRVPRDWDRYEVYMLKFGERLEDIARARRITVKELKRINNITDSTEVRGGTEILVPREKGKASLSELPPPDEDTVLVAVPDRPFAYPDRKRIFYRTRDGDTPQAIAEFFSVAVRDVATWNNLDLDANLTSRMVLQLYVAKDFNRTDVQLVPEEKVQVVTVGSEEFLAAAEARRGRKRTTYRCKAGDTLAKVGRRVGLTPGDLARINQFSYSSELKPGQEIVVYVPMTAQAKKEAQGRLRKASALERKFRTKTKKRQR